MDSNNSTEETGEVGIVPTVAGNVLLTFFDELAKSEDLVEATINLKKLVMEDGVFSEPAIRAVIFPDAS